MSSLVGAFIGPASEARDYAPVLRWILLNCVLVFFLLVLWNFGLIQALIETDPTRVSLIIVAIFVLTAAHCLFQTTAISRELNAARRAAALLASEGASHLKIDGDRVYVSTGGELAPGILSTHVARLVAKGRNGGGGRLDQTLLLRSLADKLKSREKLGWFVSEALLRLALLGTAIGFILMLIPITAVSSFDTETLRVALTGMTEGMAIALNVTVTGIAAALILKLEYYLLDGAISELFNLITEVTEVHVVPPLERTDVRT